MVGPDQRSSARPRRAGHRRLATPRGAAYIYSGYDRPHHGARLLDNSCPPAGARGRRRRQLGRQTVGVLDYDFAASSSTLTAAPTVQRRPAARGHRAPSADQLAVATFNVENLDPGDPQTKFDRLARADRHNLRAPDLIAVEEIQDNSGATDDGTVAGDQTVGKLVAAIRAAGGPTYNARRSTRWTARTAASRAATSARSSSTAPTAASASSTGPGGAATTPAVTVAGAGQGAPVGQPRAHRPDQRGLERQPQAAGGRVHVPGPEGLRRGEPLQLQGRRQALFGRFQPPVRSARSSGTSRRSGPPVRQRSSQPTTAKVVVLGDINDFEFSQTADILVAAPSTRWSTCPDAAGRALHATCSTATARSSTTSWSAAVLAARCPVRRRAHQLRVPRPGPDHDPQVVRLRDRHGKG